VQDPIEADFDGMPQSAIATELVDLVLPIEAMPDYLLRFARTRPKVELLEEADRVPGQERQALQNIFAQLRARTGQDFSKYKRSTVLRRLRRRMQLHQRETLESYLELLRESPNEARQLADDFLITVTQFFRDRESFEYLEQHAIPTLFKGKEAGGSIRVWSVGCATGEEAYSIAMLLLEQTGHHRNAPELQVFATDLHETSLKRARDGIYPDSISADVAPERLQRFFTKQDSSYRIRKEVRDRVVFASHNLLRDPPFSHMDLIICRNLLIYLQREPQHDVLELFHYALNPNGILMLGPSETVDRPGLFRAESKHHAVYRRRNVPPPEPRLPVFLWPTAREAAQGPGFHHRSEPPTSYGALHQKMVERFALPNILVNQEGHVVHVSEHAGRYLKVSGGDLSASVFRLAREELRLELRAALHAASQTGKNVRTKPIAMQLDGKGKHVVMHVRPTRLDELDGCCLVIFDEMDSPELALLPQGTQTSADGQGKELEDTKAQLRAIIEQYDSSQEEMRASNEELQSANEELRSAMEELETSKEELQSMNEELQTVNQENRHKVEELSQLTSDLNNLIAATEIATLFLDPSLRILRVTPRVADLFNVRPNDRGRPLTDFTNRLGYSRLPEDAQSVLERLVPIEREVLSQEGFWYLMRILPYRTDDRIQGVVVTFIEITERKKTELALRESEESFRALVTASAQTVWRTDAQGKMVEDSPSWRAFTGQTFQEWQGEGWLNAVHPDDREQARKAWLRALEQEMPFEHELRVMHVSREWRWTHVKAVPLRDDHRSVRGWVGMNTDVTERRRAEEELRQADERKDQFLASLGHELRNPLAPLRTVTDLLKKKQPDDAELRRMCRIFERQVLHLVRLVDDLLDVSRIKTGRIRLHLQRLDIRDVVRDVAADIESTTEACKQTLLIEQPHQPLIVEGDATRLVQIVINLLDNAAKYTPEGGRISIATRRAGSNVELSVTDTGIGISQEALHQIFDTFYQVSHEPAGAGGGLGLGLALVRQLAELHRGSVEVHSDGPGQGCEFIVRLPLAADPTSPGDLEAPAASGSNEHQRADSPVQKPRRILVVDDNKDAADALALFLQMDGHAVRCVYDGRSALEVASEFMPEVVLLDIGLPDMDGYALAQNLRRQAKNASATLIAVTGYGQEGDRDRSAESGIDHHLIKPVDTAELLRLLGPE
jgi:two-component system CheB/CheR fusion protein